MEHGNIYSCYAPTHHAIAAKSFKLDGSNLTFSDFFFWGSVNTK